MKPIVLLIHTAIFVLVMAGTGAVQADETMAPVQVITAAPAVMITESDQTPTERMRDFMRGEEGRVCSELRRFAEENIFKNPDFIEATQNRSPRDVMAAAKKYALILHKDFTVEYLFYHPNTRYFVRINDKNYRGRMRLPSEVSSSNSACFWERLPSDDVVYSVLLKVNGEKTGYIKMSKTLPSMISNLPDALSEYGKVRVYTALDKMGLNKMAWFKMRRKEPNRAVGAGWCTTEYLAFLSAIGPGEKLSARKQKKVLSLIDKDMDFISDEMKLSGGALPIIGIDQERLGAIVYTIKLPETTEKNTLEADKTKDDKE